MLFFSCENTKIATRCWITINKKVLEPNKKDTSRPRQEAAVRWQEGCNHNKTKFHTSWGVTHKLENNNTKEVLHCYESSEPHVRLPSLGIWQRVWECPGNLTLKTSGNWLQDFQRTGENRDSSLGGHKHNILGTKTQEKGIVTPLRQNQIHLLVLEGLLWSHRSERPHHRDGGAGSSSPEDGPWHESSWRSPLSLPWSPQTQGLVSTGQKNTREGAQPHPSEDNWIKALLSKALPARARSTFSHCQSLPSGSLHKPLSLLHQKADRRITIPHWLKQNHITES